MKKSALLIGILAFLALLPNAFANPSIDSKYTGTVTLDQFNDVIFEQFSPTSFALNLLQAKKQFKPTDLVIGGSAETDLQNWNGNKIVIINPVGIYQKNTVLYFTQATIDVMMNTSPWATVFLSGSDSAIGQSGSNANYYYLPRSFVLFGNVEKFPLFLTAGINTIPFGQFAGSGVWNRPLTLGYFFPQQAPQISLGFHSDHWDLNATNFRDQLLYQTHSAYSLKYSNTIKSFNYSIGAGYLTHLNFNTTGWPTLELNGIPVIANLNAGNIRDFNAKLGYQRVTLLGEYLVGSQNININNHHPNAFSLVLNYTPNIFGTDYLLGVNYSKANDLAGVPTALAGQDQLPLAAAGVKNAWAVSAARNFTKWFVLGLAAERDVTYVSAKTYTYTIDFSAYL